MRKGNFNLRISNFSVLLFLLPLFFSSCEGNDWQVYETSEFSIEFPGAARDTVSIQGTFSGARTFYEPVEGSLDSNLYYAVSLYTLPDSITLVKDDMDELLKNDVRIYAYGIGGVLADSGRVIKSGDVEGREFKVFLEGNKGVATIRKFASGKHLYTLLVVTENMKLNNSAIRQFMESFKLKKSAQKK
jgi:hypothetical protein